MLHLFHFHAQAYNKYFEKAQQKSETSQLKIHLQHQVKHIVGCDPGDNLRITATEMFAEIPSSVSLCFHCNWTSTFCEQF
jgi:hypothetical protein